MHIGTLRAHAVAPKDKICMRRASTRARGDERLSAKKKSESDPSGRSRHSKDLPNTDKKGSRGGGRGGSGGRDLGRALRSIYDDTLREPVPDDFISLIGKLS